MEALNPRQFTPASPLSETEIYACLDRGGAIVTGNRRTARALRRNYAAHQERFGRSAWVSPLIDDWESWTSSLWKQHLLNAPDAPLLLSPLQERSIWKRLSGLDQQSGDAIAAAAASAWRLLSDYRAHAERHSAWANRSTPDAELFRKWAAAFGQECSHNRWKSHSDLPELLTESLHRSAVSLPVEILLFGFDQFTPARRALADAAERAGAKITFAQSPQAGSPVTIVRALDLLDELSTCAWWAKTRLQQSPGARIAIIVPRIEEVRGELERVFRRVLTPEAAGIESNTPAPYEFSLGQPLGTVPVIKAALLTLRWAALALEQAAASWLMTSGFLTGAEEDLAEMAAFDAEVRRHAKLPPLIPLDELVSYRPRRTSASISRLLLRLRGLRRQAQSEGVGQKTKTISEWLDLAHSSLGQAGWPGHRPLDSVEYQALDRWDRFISEMATLSFDGRRVDYETFLATIEHHAGETIFSPQSRDAPIQIMGVLESAGLHSDAVWFLGADNRRWPGSARMHPLLPFALQRKTGMPHADPEADWKLALAVTRRIAVSAPACFFSYSQRDAAGDLLPSSLLEEACGSRVAQVTTDRLRKTLEVPRPDAHRRRALLVEDDSDVPWPRQLQAGGTDILKRQSACAFQSFAVRRLGAEALEEAERGLNFRDRGTVLHELLERIWSPSTPPEWRLTSRTDLSHARANGRLEAIVAHHLDEVLPQQPALARDTAWSRHYQQMERSRLRTLLLEWLDHELKRTDFSVQATETSFNATIHGLELRLRVDRIDRVEGGEMILDYKSSKVGQAKWEGERPEEPQLPLYAVHGPAEHLRGVAFAQLYASEICFKGRVEDAALIGERPLKSGLPKYPLTDEVLRSWSDTLDNLAGQFLAGEASVAPREFPKTCKYCPLSGLCRINESSSFGEEDEQGDEDDVQIEEEDV